MNKIPAGSRTAESIIPFVEKGFRDVEDRMGVARIGSSRLAAAGESYLFMDEGVLKLYNSTTETEYTVTVS